MTCTTCTTCTLTLLAPPPSVNKLYCNVPRVGRVKTQDYRRWAQVAHADLRRQKPPRFTGRVGVQIRLPMATRGDVDNRAKAVLDALQSAGVVVNDRQCDPVHIGRADVPLTTIVITEAHHDQT